MTYIPMSERLTDRNVHERHVFNIAKRIADRKSLTFMGGMRDKYSNAIWIRENATAQLIDAIDGELKEEYKNIGGKAFKRGRPPGALNKNKASVDALEDLPQENDAMSVDEIAKELEVPVERGDLSRFATKDYVNARVDSLRDTVQEARNDFENGQNNLLSRINEIVDNRPTIIELKRHELPNIELGIQHKNFPLLAKAAQARLRSGNHLNLWLHGPAGTGKTTAAEKLSEMMFGEDYQMHVSNKETRELFRERFNRDWENYNYNGALTSAFQLTGYMDAHGRYVPTAFRKAWEFGGVYLFDEIDGSMPDALLAMNGALANGVASFPDGMVKRHKDCLIIAGANTTGMGGGIEYVGAMKQNAAFLNRFVYIAWPHDNALEDALCANKDWIERVRHVRAKFATQGNKGHLITMRATIFGEALLAAGLSQDEVEDACLKQGLSDAQWEAIRY